MPQSEPDGIGAAESGLADSEESPHKGPVEIAKAEEQRPARSLPPLPPIGSDSPPVAVALGVQLMQQSSLDRLDPEIQKQIIALADELDRRQYDYHCRQLDQRGKLQADAMQDGGVARKQGITSLSILAGIILFLGAGGTYYLFSKGEYQWGYTVLMAGFGLIGAFLGGTGLPGLFRAISRIKSD